MSMSWTAEQLYDIYLKSLDRQGIDGRTWRELGDLDKTAWRAVAKSVADAAYLQSQEYHERAINAPLQSKDAGHN